MQANFTHSHGVGKVLLVLAVIALGATVQLAGSDVQPSAAGADLTRDALRAVGSDQLS